MRSCSFRRWVLRLLRCWRLSLVSGLCYNCSNILYWSIALQSFAILHSKSYTSISVGFVIRIGTVPIVVVNKDI